MCLHFYENAKARADDFDQTVKDVSDQAKDFEQRWNYGKHDYLGSKRVV
jgi:hypothetical protein